MQTGTNAMRKTPYCCGHKTDAMFEPCTGAESGWQIALPIDAIRTSNLLRRPVQLELPRHHPLRPYMGCELAPFRPPCRTPGAQIRYRRAILSPPTVATDFPRRSIHRRRLSTKVDNMR
jgi:hypothetical protein